MSFANIASKLRSEALFQLILNAFHAFKEKYDYIITGTYTIDNQLLNAKGKINGLLDIYAAIMANHPVKDRFAKSNTGLKKHSVTAGYNNIAVLKNSLGGYEVMSELLKTHIAALHNLNKLQSQMILLTAPTEFIHKSIHDSLNKRDARSWVEILSPQQQIEQIRLLNDYLTGLTDNAALRLFRHLKGHEQVGFI
jgi:dGTP triphosphohydrolase